MDLLDGYESPMKIIQQQINTVLEDNIMTAVQKNKVDTNKEELIRALNYDRGQYSQGYKNGYNKALKEINEQGLFQLPCKIGDDVYFIPSKTNYALNILSRHRENNRVYHQKVSRITFTEKGWYLECDKDLEYGTDHILVDIFYKETWFLSQEQAEQALAKMESEVKS